MKYREWQEQVPKAITDDILWRSEIYRKALFAGDLAWFDTRKLIKDRSLVSLERIRPDFTNTPSVRLVKREIGILRVVVRLATP
jgi:hypothetical protein